MQRQKTPFLAWSTTRWPTGKRGALKNIQKPVRSSRALNHYTSLEDLSSLSSNSMVLFHPCSVSPHSQHSPLLYYRNKHHFLNWELRFETGTDSEISSLAAIQRLKFSLTAEPVAILKPHSFSVCCWCWRWNCGWLSSETWKELWCTFYFIFLNSTGLVV